ncbi:MAG: hypothetical protein ACLTC8_06370 [Lachnospiraceae bacterium]
MPIVDVIARAEDASKISRIVERFNFSIGGYCHDCDRKRRNPKTARPRCQSQTSAYRKRRKRISCLDALMGKPVQKEENAPNPSVAKTEKSPLSEPTSEKQSKSAEGATMTNGKTIGQGRTAENQREPQGAGKGRFAGS